MEAARKIILTTSLKIWNEEISQMKEHAYLKFLNSECQK
jgi:hypothetical protein